MVEHRSLGELPARWQSDLRAAGLESTEARSGVAEDGVAAAAARFGGVRLPHNDVFRVLDSNLDVIAEG